MKRGVLLLFIMGFLLLHAGNAAASTTTVIGTGTYTLVGSTVYTITTYWTYPGTDTVRTTITNGSVTTKILMFYYNEGEGYNGDYTTLKIYSVTTITRLTHIVIIAPTFPSVPSEVSTYPIIQSVTSTMTSYTITSGTTVASFSERQSLAVVDVWTYTSSTHTYYSMMYFFLGYRLQISCPIVTYYFKYTFISQITSYNIIVNSSYSLNTTKTILYDYTIVTVTTLQDVPYTSLDTKTYFAGSMLYHSTRTYSTTYVTFVMNNTTYTLTVGDYSGLKELTTDTVTIDVTTITITAPSSITPVTFTENVVMFFNSYFVYSTYYSTSRVTAIFREYYVLTYVPSEYEYQYGCFFFFYENVFINYYAGYFEIYEYFFIGGIDDVTTIRMTFTF